MRSRAAVGAALTASLLLVVLVVAVGARQERHQVGSNLVRPITFIATVPGGKRVCQPVTVPKGTGGVGLRVGTYGKPGPELRLVIDRAGAGASAVRGTLAAGWRQGDIVVPIKETRTARREARLCIRNAGEALLAFAGGPGTGGGAVVGRRNTGGQVRVEYVEPRPRSWWSAAPAMARRLGVVRDAVPGQAALWLSAMLALVVSGGALGLAVREGRR